VGERRTVWPWLWVSVGKEPLITPFFASITLSEEPVPSGRMKLPELQELP